MMKEAFMRTRWLLGPEAMEKLAASRVAVFGVGGVGGYAVEGLVRSGIGAIDIIDHDRVDPTNLNRQIIATTETVGQYKVDAAKQRIRQINPECRVITRREFFLPENRGRFDFTDYDYVVDAIDTVAGKLALIEASEEAGTPIICSMGAGNKLDPSALEVADIYETSVCPLARVIRRECRLRGIEALKVVYSREPALTPRYREDPREEGFTGAPEEAVASAASGASANPGAPEEAGEDMNAGAPVKNGASAESGASEETGAPEEGCAAARPRQKQSPGSTAFVPSVAGLIIAGEVVKDLADSCRK